MTKKIRGTKAAPPVVVLEEWKYLLLFNARLVYDAAKDAIRVEWQGPWSGTWWPAAAHTIDLLLEDMPV